MNTTPASQNVPPETELMVPFEIQNIPEKYRVYYKVKRNNLFAIIQSFRFSCLPRWQRHVIRLPPSSPGGTMRGCRSSSRHEHRRTTCRMSRNEPWPDNHRAHLRRNCLIQAFVAPSRYQAILLLLHSHRRIPRIASLALELLFFARRRYYWRGHAILFLILVKNPPDLGREFANEVDPCPHRNL
jgi:hypothetical protein